MRRQTDKDLKIIREEKDLIDGNINRMCVTEDLEELDMMAQHAIRRIKVIQTVNRNRLTESEDEG